MKYTTIDRILSKLDRDLGQDYDKVEIIEWIGDALGFLETESVLENKVEVFIVKDYEIDTPLFFREVVQILKDNKGVITNPDFTLEASTCGCSSSTSTDSTTEEYLKPFIFANNFCTENELVVVRKSTSNFAKSFIDKTEDTDEYTIIGAECQKIRFSFKDGIVVMSYLRNYIDDETGYPYIPDTSQHIEAITYYIKWKLLEEKAFRGERGYLTLASDFERKWLRYVKQANNYAKMPKSVDDYQNILDSSVHLILDRRKYHKYFNNFRL